MLDRPSACDSWACSHMPSLEGRNMLEFIKIATLPASILLAFVLLLLLFRGPKVVPNLARSGFSLKTWLTAKGLRDDAGSTIRSANGLIMRVNRDGEGNRQVVVDETINLSTRSL